MPNIETFENKVAAPRADSAGSEAFELEGRHIESAFAQGGQAIGAGISSVGNSIENHNALVDTGALTSGFADLEMKSAQDLEAAKTSMDPHDTDAASKFIDDHEADLEALSSKINSQQGRAMFNKMAADYRVNQFNRVTAYQSAAAADAVVTDFKSAFDTRSNQAQQDPTTVMSSINALTDAAPGLPAEHRESVLKQGVTQIVDSGAQGVIDRLLRNKNFTTADVDAARAFIDDPRNPYSTLMSPGQYDAIHQKLDSLERTQGNVQSVIAAQTLEAGYKQIAGNGGVDPGGQFQNIINNYQGKTADETAEFQARAQRDYDAAVATGKATVGAKTTPDNELTQNIADLKAKAASASPEESQKYQDAYKAVVEAKKARDEAFKKDPADWLNTNNDVIGARFQDFINNPSQQTFQAYAQASQAEQTRLYPNLAPKLIPDAMEQQIGRSIQQAQQGDKGPAAVGGIVTDLVQKTGAYWPQIAIQLRTDKVVSGNVGVGAELFGSPSTQALGETILQASALSPTDLKDRFGVTTDKAMGPVNAALKPLIATMRNLPNADRIISDYRNAAIAAVQYTGDVNSATATVQKMLTDRYDITDTTLRIPKSLGVDADRVGDGASAVRGDIGSHQLVLPPGFAAMHVSPNRYAAQIASSGKWYTNENNTGALLYDADGHNVQEVRNGKTVDVELSWDELGKVADKQPLRAADRAIAGFFGGQ